MKELLEFIAREGILGRSVVNGKELKLIGVYSPVGKCLQTSFAFVLGQLLSKKHKVLYLNTLYHLFLQLCHFYQSKNQGYPAIIVLYPKLGLYTIKLSIAIIKYFNISNVLLQFLSTRKSSFTLTPMANPANANIILNAIPVFAKDKKASFIVAELGNT